MGKDQNTHKRRRFSADEKARILKLHFVEKRPVSDICSEFEIAVSQFHSWEAVLFQNAKSSFENKRGPKANQAREAQKVAKLEEKIREKDHVIAELMAEYLESKKKNGEDS